MMALRIRDERQRLRKRRDDSDSAIHCTDKDCFLEHVMMQNCKYYLQTNNTDCDIPCKLNGCQFELHHFILCPIWVCHNLTTTTFATTTATQTTTASGMTSSIETTTTSVQPITFGPLPPLDHPAYLILSFAANVLLLFMVLLILAFKCRKHFRRCLQRRRYQQVQERLNSHRRVSVTNSNELFTLSNSSDGEL